MSDSLWIPCNLHLPPNGEVVETKIHDFKGRRNECQLKRDNNLWYLPDGSMYVYFTPTHWRFVREKKEQ